MNNNSHETSPYCGSPFSPAQNLHLRTALDKGLTLTLKHLTSQLESYCKLIEEDIGDSAEARTYLDKMQKTIRCAFNWLDTSENSLLQLEPPPSESIDAVSLVTGVVRRCQKILQSQCRIEGPAAAEPVFVRGGMFELQECMMRSVLASAYSLFPDADVITVEAEVTTHDDKYFDLFKSSCKGGSYLQVTFSPQGTKTAENAQKPFIETLALTSDLPAAQNKLGLLEMYGILLSHGGEGTLSRQHNRFTCLNLLLPVEGTYKEVGVGGSVHDQSLYGNETILLVDDEDMIWDVIIDMLQELGYTVILAGNGNEAVQIYSENPEVIDLVILDMVMPGMDGHTAFFELQDLDPDVKVLLHSAYVSEDDVREVMDAGAIGFLQKPYRIADLARKIREIFGFPQQ